MKTLHFFPALSLPVILGAVIVLLLLMLTMLWQKSRKAAMRHTCQAALFTAEKEGLSQRIGTLEHEKEWLEQEIHHRVKNNLQIVMSLLNSQLAYLISNDAIAAIQNSQNRLHAMSLIHQKLFETQTLSCVDMSWYICEIISYLRKTYDTGNRINFTVNTAPVQLDVSQAVPLGLILNEALSNTLLHAFPNGKPGQVNVALEQRDGKNYLLRIQDNGLGLPLHETPEHYEKLGFSLMKGLAEQMDGKFHITSASGVRITIEFIKNTD
ncbi:MAG: sensor histidine kinase [Flavobacterium sp.]